MSGRAETYTEKIEFPSFSDDFDISFLPEGGVLVPGPLQRLAFKAVGSDGLAAEVTGILYDGQKEIAAFSTEHRGMGVIGIAPAAGRSYRAEVTGPYGVTKTMDIPVAASGCPIQVSQDEGMVMCSIAPTADIDPARLALVVHCGGRVVAAEEFAPDVLRMRLDKALFHSGIAQISVVDKFTNAVLSRRLVFIEEQQPVYLSVEQVDREEIDKPRRGVTLDISAFGVDGSPVAGEFSLAVTDASVVEAGGQDIRGWLLLSSDLKGYVEHPELYFDGSDPRAAEHLDLVMLTHGWSHFDISALLADTLEPYDIQAETSPTITGELRNTVGNNLKEPVIIAVDQYNDFSRILPMEGSGRFRIEDVDVRDSAWVALQAVRRGGEDIFGLVLDVDEYPVPALPPCPLRGSYRDHLTTLVPPAYTDQFRINYNIENGEITGTIDPVTVYEQKTFVRKPDHYLLPEELEDLEEMTVRSGIMKMGAIVARNLEQHTKMVAFREIVTDPNTFIAKIIDIPAFVIFDGRPAMIDQTDLLAFPMKDVASMELYGKYSIVIRSKSGKGLDVGNNPSMVTITNIGRKSPVEFYQPKYDVPETLKSPVPDMRTTLLWAPDIITDQDGNAQVFFYTGDKDADYNVDLQGISADGRPVVCRTTIKRTK